MSNLQNKQKKMQKHDDVPVIINDCCIPRSVCMQLTQKFTQQKAVESYGREEADTSIELWTLKYKVLSMSAINMES